MVSSRGVKNSGAMNHPSESAQEVLGEQLLWLIKLRWIAVVCMVIAGIAGTYVFPVLGQAGPVYICAGLLLLCNVVYYVVATKQDGRPTRKDIVLSMVQVEIDLLVLTTLLHFSGGLMNPFVLFYVFHVILATIILSRALAFSVGLSAICMYGLLALGELKGWFWLKHCPLQLERAGALWNNPVYVLWVFVAFVGMVVLAQYLTRTVITRMRSKEEEVARINEMLRKSQIEMAQREKMVAIGQMASGIAHEIGNPLNSLSSAVQYLGRKFTNSKSKEQFGIIDKQVRRISDILKHMLGLVRPASNEYTWLDVNKVIDDTLALVRYDKRARAVDINSIPDNNLPTIWLKRQNLEQVLLNVFLNALDAMTSRTDEQRHILRVTREIEDGMIEIRVTDSGGGMSDEVCRRAFEPFFTTKESSRGTGLGLYISRNLIEEIGGTIVLENNADHGATVIIRLPVSPAKELVAPQTRSSEPASVRQYEI